MPTLYSIRNWFWDLSSIPGVPHKTWRGWVIIDASDGRWTQWLVGQNPITLGDGHTLGSTATTEEILSIRRIVARLKPAGGYVVNIIVTFSSTLFRPSNPPGPPMPTFNYAGEVPGERATNAIYWPGV